MTQVFADRLPTRPAPLALPAMGRRPSAAALVRPLWLAITALLALATLAVVVTADRPAAAQAPAAVTPLRLVCAPTYAGAGSLFHAAFTVSGGATNITRWQIDYGDGTTATAATLDGVRGHAYTSPGVYLAQVTATAADGTTATSSCATQWLWVPPPSA